MGQRAAAACPLPRTLSFQVVRAGRRDMPGCTEGLEWHDGAIWESTGGMFGKATPCRIDPATGHLTSLVKAARAISKHRLRRSHQPDDRAGEPGVRASILPCGGCQS
jgi:hypothetical protein